MDTPQAAGPPPLPRKEPVDPNAATLLPSHLPGSTPGPQHACGEFDRTVPGPPATSAEASVFQSASSAEATCIDPSVPGQATPGRVEAVASGYEILEVLGRGGMGVVYKARQVGLNRVVALKMILAGAHADAAELTRFKAEAEAAARLHHPNIVQIHDVGQRDGQPYFSLEFVDGSTLDKRLAGAPQPSRPAVRLVEILARAMHAAHQQGVVHRDLKPANILLAGTAPDSVAGADRDMQEVWQLFGTPKISDFGLAKRLDSGAGQTRSGDVLGTPSYMAPEQAAGSVKQISPAADVYSLGAILYELLTGRPPFRAATAMETLWQVVNEEPVALSRLRPRLARDLERICLKCLEKDPRKRYASALDLADDLRRHLNGEPVHARPPGLVGRLWRWSRRNPLPASLLVAVTLGSAFGLWYLSGLSESLVRMSAIESAAQQSETLEELNRYYTNVVNHLKSDYKTAPPPATFTIELGQRITAHSTSGVQVRLYSEYPFRTRKGGGARDDFERQALAHLQANPHEPFYRFEDFDGRPSLRYATGRMMTAGCVHCHNTHAESTKKDWKVGDLRGILEIIRPLDKDAARIRRGLRGTFTLVAVVGASLLAVSFLLVFLARRRQRLAAADFQTK
jgi:serine/threonine protein kinase